MFLSNGMLRMSGVFGGQPACPFSSPPRTFPSLSNAHTPVHIVKAPSLSRMVFPSTRMSSPSDHTLMAASGAGLPSPCSGWSCDRVSDSRMMLYVLRNCQ